MSEKVDIQILRKALNVAECVEWIKTPEAGGIDVFIGTVRDSTKGKKVIRLEFEAYESMALKEMKKIAEQSFEQWPLKKVLIHHRTGILQVGEIPVVIA